MQILDWNGRPVVAGVVAVAMVVAIAVAVTPDVYLLTVLALVAAVGTVIGVAVQLDRPLLGLAVLLVTALAFPVEFPGPSSAMVSTSLPLAAFVCGVWLLRVLVLGRLTRFDRSRATYAGAALAAIALTSFAMGQLPWFPAAAPLPAQLAGLSLILVSICLFLAVGHQLRTLDQLRWITWLLIGVGAVTCLVQTVPGLRAIGPMTTRPGSVGSLFWTWLLAMSVAQGLFNRELAPATRLALLGVGGLVLFHGLQVPSWASGWLPPVVALGAVCLFKLPRISVGLAAVAVPLGLVVGGYLASSVLAEEEFSLLTRREAWVVLWQIIVDSPLLGTGPSNYYYFTENFSLLGWNVRFISHNNYQDLIVQTGFLGLLAFLWFSFEIFWMTLRLWQMLPAGGFVRAYTVGAIGGLLGSLAAGMLGDWIIPFYYNAGILGFRSSLLFWVMLGGVLAMKRMVTGDCEVPATWRHPGWRPSVARHPLAEAL